MADEAQAPQGELLVYQGQGLNAPVLVRLQGETLWLTQRLMAELYGTTVAKLAADNGIKNPNLIHVGQVITINK